ncbi:MAG: ABC transporter ATP-binding protein [Candidatus Bathyarchaeia archaeon]
MQDHRAEEEENLTEKGILSTEKVVKRFGGLRAVDGVTLSVRSNSITGLIGPNGSGKTTLFNVISGVYSPDEGHTYFNGKRIDSLQPHEIWARGLVRTFQIPRLYRRLTVLDNLMLGAVGNVGEGFLGVFRNWKAWRRQEEQIAERAIDVLGLLELDKLASAPASDISGGQMKLLEIGRALMSEPKMLLLDEPAAGVNPTMARRIFERITHLREKLGLTFFIIEHRIDVLSEHADKICVMHEGQIIAEGPPEDVVKDPHVISVYLGEG